MTKIEEIEWKLDTLTKMHKNAKEDYEKISNDINECQKALAELKESKKEGKWKPNYGDYYWLRDDWGNFRTHEYCAGDCMDWRLKNVPLFPTKEECERYWHFMDTVKEKSYEFSKEDFENEDSQKWFIAYDYHSKRFYPDNYLATKMFGVVNFKTYKDAQYIIDNFKDELMEYWI